VLLDVEVDTTGARPVIRAMHKEKIAGSITSSIIQKIAECIDAGYVYVAEVISVQGGTCKVRVRVR
jgi:hypothetical protein